MTSEASFRVIWAAIQDHAKEDKAAIACVVAATFDVKEADVLPLFDLLPVVLFDDIDTENLRKIKERLIFLSKLGLDFTITFKPFPNLYRARWRMPGRSPVISCPCCGEDFLLLRAEDFRRLAPVREAEKPIPPKAPSIPPMQAPAREQVRVERAPTRETPMEMEEISGEIDEVEVLSEELEAMLPRDAYAEGIEEVESLSDEMKPVEDISSLEGIDGISAEFEEIEGVSAEFEKICMGGLDTDIGSLSAELEEIEGISAELDPAELQTEVEKIRVQPESLHKIGAGVPKKPSPAPHEESGDYELEEIEEISAELEKIADPLYEKPQNLADSKLPLQSPLRGGRRSVPVRPPAKGAAKPKVAKPVTAKAGASRPPAPENRAIGFPPGDCDVVIQFGGKGNVRGAAQLLAMIQGIAPEKIDELAEQKSPVAVAKNVSREAAERILVQFEKLKMQGKIAPSRKKR